MTLTYEPDLNILKTYLHTKNTVFRSRLLNITARTGQTHTHKQTDGHTYRQTDARKRITNSYSRVAKYKTNNCK